MGIMKKYMNQTRKPEGTLGKLMREKDLPIDRGKHKVYTQNAKNAFSSCSAPAMTGKRRRSSGRRSSFSTRNT